MKRYLVLENGSVYQGRGFGADVEIHSEIVFSTGMTGYQETMTDPSYYGQMMVFTYPLIGNYGVNEGDLENPTPAVNAILVHEAARRPGNFRSQMSINEYAEKNQLPGIQGLDTRQITKEIRDEGAMDAVIVDRLDWDHIHELFKRAPSNRSKDSKRPTFYQVPDHQLTVALIDFGYKNSIVDALLKRKVAVRIFTPETSAEEILNTNSDGVLLSNGPGDPKRMLNVLETVRILQAHLPLMGICFGHQIFALANGGDTYKMKFGHRGFNHAVKGDTDVRSNFTSQNHGYAVSANSISNTDLKITYREINDGTVEGLKAKNGDAFSVQFHPDASPGPHDAEFLFDYFVQMMQSNSSKGGNKDAQELKYS